MVANAMLRSWRPGTQKWYSTWISKWFKFCSERSDDSPDKKTVLKILNKLFKQGVG